MFILYIIYYIYNTKPHLGSDTDKRSSDTPGEKQVLRLPTNIQIFTSLNISDQTDINLLLAL